MWERLTVGAPAGHEDDGVLAALDADGDGVVSYREFIDFVEKIPVDESGETGESKDDGGEAKAEAKW